MLRTRRNVLAVGSGTAALLAACGIAPAAQDSAPSASQQPVTLRFVPAGWHADLDQVVVDQFHAENPRITVSFEPQSGNYVDKITAMQAGGDLPDVIYVADAHVKPCAANKIAADMEKLAAKDKASQALLKDVYPAMLDLGRVKSIPGQYMLPWALDVLVMYYNKTMFRSAGVELPKPTWTVDDMITAAKRLTKEFEDPAQAQYGLTLSWTAWAEYVPWMRGYGGDMVSQDGKKQMIDAAGSIDGIEAMASLVTRHKVAPPIGTNFGGNAFHLGKVAMMFTIRNGTVAIRKNVGANFDWDVELRPAFPKKRVTGMGTAGEGVSTQTKHPDLAWQLAKYTISPPAQKIYATSYGAIPVLQSMRNDPSWRNLPAPPANADAFVKAADYGTLPPDFPLACGTVYVGDLNVLMRDTLTDIVNGKVAASAGLRAAAARVNSCMASG
ncbi:MAG: extracellular solute-binding protein [Chloroflexi bacterium]|nr:extracellular solute-binding protein [Chloroflexota bacterium]